MGIDYSAGYADVIEWDAIEKIVPQVAAEFLETVNKYKGDEDADYLLRHLALTVQYDLDGDPSTDKEPAELINALCGWHEDEADDARVAKEILAAFNELRAAFATATTVSVPGAEPMRVERSGLSLGIGYHDCESHGCRGDEVDGIYWYVDGAYQLSPAGRKFQDKFQRKFFTSWG
jgi:hypothetical protein